MVLACLRSCRTPRWLLTVMACTVAFAQHPYYLVAGVPAPATRYGYIRKVANPEPGALRGLKDWKVPDLDPGTVHVYLNNWRDEPVGIENIGVSLEEPEHADLLQSAPKADGGLFYWWQVVPNPIPPGMVGDLMIKLKKPLADSPYVTVTYSTGGQVGGPFANRVPEVRITYIAFSEDLRKVYLYCKNVAQKEFSIRDIEILPADTKVDTIKYIPSNRLKPDELCCMVISLRRPLNPGQFIWCAVKTAEQYIAGCAMTRAYTHFPIQAFGNDHRPELSFDQDNFEMSYPGSEEQWQKAQSQPWYKAYHVLDDPVCADSAPGKQLGFTAQEVIRRADTCRQRDAVHPTVIYMCEYMKPASYFVYGEITDLVAIDPYPIVLEGASLWRNADYVLLAKLASEPRPLYTIPEAFMFREEGPYVSERYPTPEEERLTVYVQLAYGSKGIWYFLRNAQWGYEGFPPLQEEIGRINSELQVLRPYLQISEPVDWAKSETPNTEAHALLCGDKGLVLIAINNNFQSWPRHKENPYKPGEKPFAYQPANEVVIFVKLPGSVNVSHVQTLQGGDLNDTPFSTTDDGITIRLPRLDLATPILLIP